MLKENNKKYHNFTGKSIEKESTWAREYLTFSCVTESTRLAVGTILSMNILVYPSFEVINRVDCNPLKLTLNTTIPSSRTQVILFNNF